MRDHSTTSLGGIPARQGFTLLELLMVMAIITLLAGLVVAGAVSARQRALIAQCTANLHELGMAIALYANDYRALPLVYPDVQRSVDVVPTFPPSVPTSGGNGPVVPPEPPPWFEPQVVLGDYISTPETFQCPVARASCPPNVDWQHMVSTASGIVLNPVKYRFNEHASGLKMTQVRCGPGRALMMFDPQPHRWAGPGRWYNALFLDGHVRAYNTVITMSPWSHIVDWPPD